MRPLRLPRRLTCAFACAIVIPAILPFPLFGQPNYATPLYFTTLAGSGAEGSADGTGTAATFDFPNDVAVDAAGNVWVADSNSGRVRKITPAGMVTTLTVTAPIPGGSTITVPGSFGQIRGIVVAANNDLIIGGYTSHTIQRVTPGNLPVTVAGQAGSSGAADGTGGAARFNLPVGVAVDAAGNIYVADYGNHAIRRITPAGVVTLFAGLMGTSGSVDGVGDAARFNFPWGLALDGAGNLYVADSGNHTIRKITPAREVITIAGAAGQNGTLDAVGTAARFAGPRDVAVHGGNIYVCTLPFGTIRKIDAQGAVTTLAGAAPGDTDGLGSAARFQGPAGLAVDANGNLYVADSNNNKIRRSVFPPTVVAPAGTIGGTLGSTVVLATQVISFLPATLQWRKNGVAIPGATTTPLSISNVQLGSEGLYSLVATSAAGSTTGANVVFTVLVPPVITSQPVSRSAAVGSAVQFSVGVTPVVGPSFLWRKNGFPISGATSSTLTIPGAALTDAGNYTVVVSHANASVTSNAATLTVVESPTVTGPATRTVNAGANVTLAAIVTPSTASIQWRKDGVVIPGATTATLVLNNVNATHAGEYLVSVTNGGVTASASSFLTVLVPPTITTQPTNQTAAVGQTAQFTVAVTPATGPMFQWRKNGMAISGATNATLVLANVTTNDAGTYSVLVGHNGLAVISNNATLTVNVPVTGQPVTHTVFVGAPVQFNFTGNPAPGTTFQWRKDGAVLPGATTANLVIPSAALSDAGDYTLVFAAGGVSQTSNTATLVVLPQTPPSITTQPVSRTALIGTTVQFSVEASSPGALAFQWRKNGAPIAGATSQIFTVNDTQLTDAGAYSVVVANAGGSVTSSDATLTVNAPVGSSPSITSQPSSQTVNAGATLSLSVSASGTTPFTYQWYRNGSAINGATTALFTISTAQGSDAGGYSVIVSNSAGTAVSTTATVSVVVPPTIATPPAGRTATVGSSVQFTVVANGSTPLTFQWRKNGEPIPGATTPAFSIASAEMSDAGSYSVVVTNAAGVAISTGAVLNIAPPAPASRISNVSIRTTLAADQTVIVGLGVAGGSRDVLVRAVGPGLAPFGVNGVMADPRLELFNGQSVIFTNDDWPATLAANFVNVGAFGLVVGSRDAAFVQPLEGSFSIQARGTAAGVVLVEAYELDTTGTSRLVNVSARNRVGTGENILIAGFTITGTGTKQLLVRAVGPGLAAFGLTGTLADPRLELFNSAGIRVVENDNWAAAIATTFTNVGAFALSAGSRDAAIVTTLPAGSYTVQVRGSDDGTGEALVEIYDVP